MPRPTRLPLLYLTLAVMLTSLSGCATFRLPSFQTEERAKAEAANRVSQVVCLWQPAEGHGLDELPARGFAGQIAFLTADSPTPVEVAGNVTIYLFDDHGTSGEQARPLHVFRFVDGSWQTHLKQTAWGPTYQLFIPYVRKGTHRASCSLAVQVETPAGRRVTSDMANILLPGSESARDALSSSPFVPQHSRFPAGRVHTVGPVAENVSRDASRVVPASAALPRKASQEAPKFESFSIPYDFRRAGTR